MPKRKKMCLCDRCSKTCKQPENVTVISCPLCTMMNNVTKVTKEKMSK